MKRNNHLLNLFKIIFAFCVILAHFPYPGIFGSIFIGIGCTASCFYLTITGFQSYSPDGSNTGVILKRLKRNAISLLIAFLIYFIYTICEKATIGQLAEWATTYLANPMTYVRMLFLNDFSFIHGDLLWFLLALLYCYVILYFMEKYRFHKVMYYIVMPLLLLLKIAVEIHVCSFDKKPSWLNWNFTSNFVVAIPCAIFGVLAKEKEEWFLKFNKVIVLITVILSAFLGILFDNVRIGGLVFSQPFRLINGFSAFILCLLIPLEKPIPIIDKLGRYNFKYIFIYHMVFGSFIKILMTTNNAPSYCINWILPTVTLIGAIINSYIALYIQKIFRSIKNNNIKAK